MRTSNQIRYTLQLRSLIVFENDRLTIVFEVSFFDRFQKRSFSFGKTAIVFKNDPLALNF